MFLHEKVFGNKKQTLKLMPTKNHVDFFPKLCQMFSCNFNGGGALVHRPYLDTVAVVVDVAFHDGGFSLQF